MLVLKLQVQQKTISRSSKHNTETRHVAIAALLAVSAYIQSNVDAFAVTRMAN
jgi:hypothetical protein